MERHLLMGNVGVALSQPSRPGRRAGASTSVYNSHDDSRRRFKLATRLTALANLKRSGVSLTSSRPGLQLFRVDAIEKSVWRD